jgi:hypothetical protein
MNLREDILHVIKSHDNESMIYDDVWTCRQIIKLIEKRIDELQDIKNLKPAENPQDVIYNCGIFDGLEKVKKEMLK